MSWPVSRLDQLADACLGKMLDKQKNRGTPRPYLRNVNVRWGTFDLSDVQDMLFEDDEVDRYSVRAGDLVVCEGGEPGRCAVWKQASPMFIQKALHRVRCGPDLAPTFLAYWLRHLAGSGLLARHFTGTTIQHLPGVKLAALDVPHPPRSEQDAIVAAIETHFSRLDAAVASLTRARANVKLAHASVLKAAVEGRLVPTEAALARAEGRDYERATALLTRILAERRARHDADQEGSSRTKKYKEPVEPETEGLPGLPEGWCWASMDALAQVVGGITKDSKLTAGRLVPYLRVANVQRGRLDLSEIKTILATEQKIDALALRPGDVLMNEGGDRDKLGRGWVWRGELPECIHQNHVFRARLWLAGLDPRYLSHYANTQGDRYFIKEGNQTTNLASISLTKVKALPVALPPAKEVGRMMVEVDRQLSVLDALDATIDTNLARCTRLRQSILKIAFQGRLVQSEATTPKSAPSASMENPACD